MNRAIDFRSWTPGRGLVEDPDGWTTPETDPGLGFTELVVSWNARTPGATWVEVAVSVTTADGRRSGWYVLGRWAERDDVVAPTSVPGQRDQVAEVKVDRLVLADGVRGSTYQVRVTAHRSPGSPDTPQLSLLGCVASDVPRGPVDDEPVSAPTLGSAVVLDVPAYSQQLHRGRYPQWAGGGESWCSPTSTSMVLAYWGLGPSPDDYAWVEADVPDRFVVHAARHTFDHAYGGPGNWPFNTAYAGRFGTRAFVTRLRGLAEAERFLEAGIPLIVALSFTEDQLTGAGYGTQGHLLVVRGVDENGDVVCNDPASHTIPDNEQVRVTYDRAEFERSWRQASGGLTYVIAPPEATLPLPPAQANW